jgi:hypothetical protein
MSVGVLVEAFCKEQVKKSIKTAAASCGHEQATVKLVAVYWCGGGGQHYIYLFQCTRGSSMYQQSILRARFMSGYYEANECCCCADRRNIIL